MSDCMPFWQNHPCPPWCAIEHAEITFVEDRIHRPDQEFATIPLTTSDPIRCQRPDGSWRLESPVLRVDMEQHLRETEPRILLRETNSAGYTLSSTEALTLGHALVQAAQLATATT